jgi:ribosomal-protein-alanine N-acetyltransferase
MPTIQTARLTIRPFTREMMLAALDDPAVAGALLGLHVAAGWPNDVERGVLAALTNQIERDPALADWQMQVFIQTEERVIIGTGGFKGRPDTTGMVDLGYGIAPAYQGQGYATEAGAALIAWAFAQPGVRRVFADCLATNPASARVLAKLGLRQLPPRGKYLNGELTAEEYVVRRGR